MLLLAHGVDADGSVPQISFQREQTLAFGQGEDVTVDLDVVRASGAPRDLTGAALTLSVKTSSVDPPILLVAQFSGTVSSPSSAGLATFSLPSSATSLLSGTYAWDLEMVLGGKRTRLVPTSVLIVDPAVTPVLD